MEENFSNNSEIDNLIEILDELWITFTRCRAIFPLVTKDKVGHKGIINSNFLPQNSINISLSSKNKLTDADIVGINKSGHYINQNFIVRVHALLDSKKIIPRRKKNENSESNNGYPEELDKLIEGHRDVFFLRRLRHKIAHSTGKYNSQDKDQKKLYEDIVEHYNLKTPPNHPDEWRLPIDKVLFPMFKGCKRYAVEYLKKAK